MTNPPIATGAAQLCDAIEAQLRANIPKVITALGYELDPPADYQQNPEVGALVAADYPAVAIASSGTVAEMERIRSSGTWSVPFALEVMVVDRGGDYADTQRKARQWADVIRGAVLLEPTIGGIADATKPVREEYAGLENAASARTLGAGSVTFEIRVEQAMNITALREAIAASTTVTTVIPTVTAHTHPEE